MLEHAVINVSKSYPRPENPWHTVSGGHCLLASSGKIVGEMRETALRRRCLKSSLHAAGRARIMKLYPFCQKFQQVWYTRTRHAQVTCCGANYI